MDNLSNGNDNNVSASNSDSSSVHFQSFDNIDANDVDVRLPGHNQSLLGDYSSHGSGEDYYFFPQFQNNPQNVNIDNNHSNQNFQNGDDGDDENTESSNIFEHYYSDASSANVFEEEKQDFLPENGVNDVSQNYLNNQANNINNFEIPNLQQSLEEETKSDKINYYYKYKFKDDLNWRHFDNNDNVANVLYSRYFNLAVVWDYASLWRKVISVFCTLKWPKNDQNVTPRDIKRAQIWGRSAIYKSMEFGRYLLHDYAFLCGGIGTYMLEAFWHYNPHGYGFYVVNQQMCEHWGNWMKHNRLDVGNPTKERYLWEIADNYDLYVMGRILADMVDFSKVVKDEKLRSQEVFNLEQNDIVEKNALILTPIYFQMIAQRMSVIQVNDIFPTFMTQLHDQEKHEFVKINEAIQKQRQAQEQFNYNNYIGKNNEENVNKNPHSNVKEWRNRLLNAHKIHKKVQQQQQAYRLGKK